MRRAPWILAAAVSAACSSPPAGDDRRLAMLRDVVESVIAPFHAELATRTAALRDAVDALVMVPDQARLDEAQAAWRAARAPWLAAMAFRVGPVMDDLFESRLDQWPVDPARIETEIAGTAELTPAYIGSLGANKQGFHAVEELLFDATGGDAAVLSSLTTDAGAERRRTYLLVAAQLVAEDAAALDLAWRADGGGFVVLVVDVGGASPFATGKEAVDAVVNELVFLSQYITDTRLGKPMGKQAGGVPQLDLVVSAPSDGTVDDLLANLDGIEDVFVGGPAGGLGAPLARASAATAQRVTDELAAARVAVAAIPRPFAASIAAQAPEVEAAWAATRALRLTIATEVVSVLGVTLSFNDNDGD